MPEPLLLLLCLFFCCCSRDWKVECGKACPQQGLPFISLLCHPSSFCAVVLRLRRPVPLLCSLYRKHTPLQWLWWPEHYSGPSARYSLYPLPSSASTVACSYHPALVPPLVHALRMTALAAHWPTAASHQLRPDPTLPVDDFLNVYARALREEMAKEGAGGYRELVWHLAPDLFQHIGGYSSSTMKNQGVLSYLKVSGTYWEET